MNESSFDKNPQYRVVIVGPNHLQNSLFATYIETYSACKSYVFNDLNPLTAGTDDSFPDRMAVLYDCLGLDHNGLNGLLSCLSLLHPKLTLILFNLDRDAGIEKSAIELGVQGFFYHDDSVETLLKGLNSIFDGSLWISRQKMTEVILEHGFALRRRRVPPHELPPHTLTHREIEILGLLTVGATNRHISERLCISPHTVRTHLNNIFRKINVSSRLEAVVWAADSLFISPKPP